MKGAEFNVLMQGLQKGDISSLQAIYEEFHEKIYAVALSIVRNKEDAQDIKTTVLLNLAQGKETEEIQNPMAYLYTLTKNVSFNY